MKQGNFLPVGALVVLLWATAPGVAQAYIDPGNGAYMVQALFTIVGAALFYLRHPIRSFRAASEWLLSRWRHRPDDEASLATKQGIED
jgi:hypothetical protein